jgi:hypothetical protein
MPQRRINCLFAALALCIAAAFLLEGIAATFHRDHVCDEESCPLCLAKDHIKNFSRQLKGLCSHFAFPMAVFLLSFFILKQFFCYIPTSSVELKIKMNT